MRDVLEDSLKNSMSYQEYRKLVADLLTRGKSTGEYQAEDLLNYSKLNNSRMKRLDKTFHTSEKTQDFIKETTKKYKWIVLTESWCGDAAHALPVINKVAEISENIELRIVLRDENEALMNHFLTNGSKSIPKLIAIDEEENAIVGTWGPRPAEASQMVNNYKEKYGSLDAAFKKELQVWYNANKGVAIENELVMLACTTANCV